MMKSQEEREPEELTEEMTDDIVQGWRRYRGRTWYRKQKKYSKRTQNRKERNRKIQKKAIKRNYQKAWRKHTKRKAEQSQLERWRKVIREVQRKAVAAGGAGIGIFLILLLLVITPIGGAFLNIPSIVLASSYLSEPKSIDAAELKMSELESELQTQIDHIEENYPDYDEYTYNLAEIGHDPFELVSYLSAIYTEFTEEEAVREAQQLFDRMYTLTLTPNVEIRTRTVTETDPETGEKSQEEEEYEVTILRVTLTSRPLTELLDQQLDDEQKEMYEAYQETKGLLQQFGSPINADWYGCVSSYYGYRKQESSDQMEYHKGIDIAVPAGTEVYAAQDGVITDVSYDSHYENYVVISQDGYVTKYAHLDQVAVTHGSEIKKGQIIGKVGNSGTSLGGQLHLECMYNGEYYNPLFYFETGEGSMYGETPGGDSSKPGNIVPPESYDDQTVQTLMKEAEKYLGYPYRWGGSSPATSFDCSGFVCYVFTNSGTYHLPRTTAQGIYDQCATVPAAEAKPGDIIFFTGTYNSPGPVSHVGIYCGNGVMIHAGDPISYANINTPYWQRHFYGFGRLY